MSAGEGVRRRGLPVTELTWAICDARGLTVTQKAVLWALASHCDADGLAFPSVARLAQEAAVSERAVQAAMGAVRRGAGPIAVEVYPQRRSDGGTGPNRYRLRLRRSDDAT